MSVPEVSMEEEQGGPGARGPGAEEEEQEDQVRDGDYIVIRKGSSMWLHKLNSNGKNPVSLKKDQVWMGAVVGRPYFSVYRMVPQGGKKQRCFSLQEVERAVDLAQEFLTGESGQDNRNIVDDGQSQRLSGEAISELQERGMSGQEIVGQLVENSRTFKEKTEYSQEKYLKKKQRKYLEYLTIQRPTLRLVSQILYARNPNKIMNLRPDSLAQLLAYCDVRSGGRYLLYETGCQGLITAAVLDRLRGNGLAVHVHPGNIPQRQAVLAMNFGAAELESLHSLNINHLVRSLEEKERPEEPEAESNSILVAANGPSCSSRTEEDGEEGAVEEEVMGEGQKRKRKGPPTPDEGTRSNSTGGPPPNKRPKLLQTLWAESRESLSLLDSQSVDGVLVVGREDPLSVLLLLLPFLALSRPFAVFCPHQDPLLQCYSSLKERGGVLNMRLTETWLRQYQVLPDRTHPHINMSGSGGYLLTGVLVEGRGGPGPPPPPLPLPPPPTSSPPGERERLS